MWTEIAELGTEVCYSLFMFTLKGVELRSRAFVYIRLDGWVRALFCGVLNGGEHDLGHLVQEWGFHWVQFMFQMVLVVRYNFWSAEKKVQEFFYRLLFLLLLRSRWSVQICLSSYITESLESSGGSSGDVKALSVGLTRATDHCLG